VNTEQTERGMGHLTRNINNRFIFLGPEILSFWICVNFWWFWYKSFPVLIF